MRPAAIQVLPPEVAARIAAGEVIERPVSVVRELLDNAIDAGSTRITLEIEEGGLALIRITDDGRGRYSPAWRTNPPRDGSPAPRPSPRAETRSCPSSTTTRCCTLCASWTPSP